MPEEHIGHDRQTLMLLYDADVAQNLKKCNFIKNRIDYLCRAIRPGRFQVSTRTIVAICGLQYPTSMTELRSFLGLCNVLHLFLPDFARVTPPFNKKLRKCQLQTLS